MADLKDKEETDMNLYMDHSACGMAHMMAEDAGAPELRNPLNSGVRARRAGRRAIRPLRALVRLIASALVG